MADVKFSELTTLAAADVATDDIFAVVDTSATTSKKLTVANLLGQVPSGAPLHINDTTDTSSGVTGAISTDGGLGVTLKSFLNGEVTIATGIIADAQDGAYLGKAGSEFSDVFLADGAVLNFGDNPADTTLTHTADTGLTLNSTRKIMFGDAASFIHQSADGVMTIDGEVTIDLNASGAVDVSNDLTLSSADAVLTMGASPNQVTITHDATNGLTIGADKKLMFNDATQFIQGASATVLGLGATDEIDLTVTSGTGTIDVNAAGGIISSGPLLPSASDAAAIGSATAEWSDIFLADSAVINFGADQDVTLTHVADAALMLNSNMALRFRDAALGINSSADGQLDVYADSTVEITLGGTAVHTFAIDGGGAYNVAFKHSRDSQDLLFQQADGVEVARIHDGGTTPATGLTAYATGLGGFGHKKNVMKIDATSENKDVTLTVAQSGSIILCDASNASYDIDITLPTGSTGMEGIHYYFVCSAAVHSSKTIDIATVGTDGNDKIFLALNLAGATSASVTGDILTIGNSAPLGTMVKCTLMSAGAGGAAEIWMAEAFQPSGSALVSVA